MSSALQRCLSLLAALALFLPLVTLAALPPSGANDSRKTEDACKTGKTEVKPGEGKGKSILGGVRTSNRISVNGANVVVSCRKLEPWEEETITVCGLNKKCKDFLKNSLQGQNLAEIADEALRGGARYYDGTYGISPEELTRRLLDTEHYAKAEDIVLNSVMHGGGDIRNAHVIDAILNYSSSEKFLFSSAREAAIQTIDEMADASLPAEPIPAVQTFPARYPASWSLSYSAGLHDAQPVKMQRLYPLEVNPDYYTIRAESPTTFEERWKNVPISFEDRWSNVSQMSPTFYQRLRDIFSTFKFW